jgi:hypothetical protein
MVDRRLIANVFECFRSHPAAGIAVNAGLVNVEVTLDIFAAALG